MNQYLLWENKGYRCTINDESEFTFEKLDGSDSLGSPLWHKMDPPSEYQLFHHYSEKKRWEALVAVSELMLTVQPLVHKIVRGDTV